MTIYVPGKLTLRKGWQPMDPDAAAYITAVETADGQALEEKVKLAIDNFVLGCKADGIWSAIKACCILAGARTLNGALTPLVGTAPTSYNFVAGDYSRETGLVGDGSTKYLDSNRANNADPQNSKHLAAYVTEALSGGQVATPLGSGSGASGTGRSILFCNQASCTYAINTNQFFPTVNLPSGAYFLGASRSSASLVNAVAGFNTSSDTGVSNTPTADNIGVFAYIAPSPGAFASGRIAFYSIGEAVNLTLFRGRVTDLINAIGAAIP